MTYIKDLIEIPDHIGRGDFVLRLSEGITDPEGTVKHYQVTPQLVKCFDEALNLVKGSLQGAGGRSSSKAAYLHGSFGSGKSHFMAILHLILAGNPHARSIPELAEVIAKHSSWSPSHLPPGRCTFSRSSSWPCPFRREGSVSWIGMDGSAGCRRSPTKSRKYWSVSSISC
jgi:hypothetical protein